MSNVLKKHCIGGQPSLLAPSKVLVHPLLWNMVRQRPLLVMTSPDTCCSRKKRPMRSKQQDHFLLYVARDLMRISDPSARRMIQRRRCRCSFIPHSRLNIWMKVPPAPLHGWWDEEPGLCAPTYCLRAICRRGGLACKPVAPKTSPAVLSSHTKAAFYPPVCARSLHQSSRLTPANHTPVIN